METAECLLYDYYQMTNYESTSLVYCKVDVREAQRAARLTTEQSLSAEAQPGYGDDGPDNDPAGLFERNEFGMAPRDGSDEDETVAWYVNGWANGSLGVRLSDAPGVSDVVCDSNDGEHDSVVRLVAGIPSPDETVKGIVDGTTSLEEWAQGAASGWSVALSTVPEEMRDPSFGYDDYQDLVYEHWEYEQYLEAEESAPEFTDTDDVVPPLWETGGEDSLAGRVSGYVEASRADEERTQGVMGVIRRALDGIFGPSPSRDDDPEI